MRITVILYLFFYSVLTYGQLVDKAKYDRLVIVDEYNDNYSIIYGRIYKLNLHDSLPQLMLTNEYRTPDTLGLLDQKLTPNWNKIYNRTTNQFIAQIDSELVNQLINTINHPKGLNSLLGFYGIDSSWFNSNKDRLLKNWLTKNENKDRIEREYAKYVLSNFENFQKMAYNYELQTYTSRYSNMTIAFENDNDTLFIHSRGQNSFLIPFVSDTIYTNYNPKFPALISEFLPNDLVINKQDLNPILEDFEKGVLNELTFKVSFIDRKKFKKFIKENR